MTADAPGSRFGSVVAADERSAGDSPEVVVDVARWSALAERVLAHEGAIGELTVTFVDREEIAALNEQHMGVSGPTDVLSFPLDEPAADAPAGVPVLLGDVVISPAVAAAQAPEHAGTVDDELALLVVHGILHVLGHDHAEDGDAATMQARERELLSAHHWSGPPPPAFRQTHP